MDLTRLRVPIVQAPLAGGPSTPRLAAAVAEAGGFGFLAAGYKRADVVGRDMRELQSLTSEPFGVNVFSPPGPSVDPGTLERYAAELRIDADRYGVELGEPRHDDDDFDAKVELVCAERVEVVSFTFGCPSPDVRPRCGHKHDWRRFFQWSGVPGEHWKRGAIYRHA